MNSEESFRNWCDKKIKINSKNNSFQPKNGEFWIYNIGINIGGEMSVSEPFIRPCMILNANMLGDLIFVVPVSTQYGDGAIKQKYYQEIEDYEKYGLVEKSYFVLNQVKIISKNRLIRNLTKDKSLGKKFDRYESEKRMDLKEFLKREILKIF